MGKKTKKTTGEESKSGGGSFFSKKGESDPFFSPSPGPVKNLLPEDVQEKMEAVLGDDFSDVTIHTNSGKAQDLNARAFTQDSDIHFAPGQYDATTTKGQELIGHELTHVVQQRSGRVTPTIQAKGVAVNDDAALEKEADTMGRKAAMADTTTSYNSGALGMRRTLRTMQFAKKGVMQLAPVDTHYGIFKDTRYNTIKTAGKETGVDIILEFHPGLLVNATKIGLTQTVKDTFGGSITIPDPVSRPRIVGAGVGEGMTIDRIPSRDTPIYGSQSLGAGVSLDSTPLDNAGGAPAVVGTNTTYQLGFRFKDKAGKDNIQHAALHDRPRNPHRNKNAGQVFETTALALSGVQQGTYYGSVQWGWEADNKGKFTQLPLTLVSKSLPSAGFTAAANAWNNSTGMGTIKTTAKSTSVFDDTFKVQFKIPQDSVVSLESPGSIFVHNNITFNEIRVAAGTHAGKTGLVRVNDMTDQGDGPATVDLPTDTVELFAGPFDSILDVAPVAQVSRTTKVKILDSDVTDALVQIVSGSQSGIKGYVNTIGGMPFTDTTK